MQLIQQRFGVAPADGQEDGGFANVESSTKTKQKDYTAYKEYYLKEKCVLHYMPCVCFHEDYNSMRFFTSLRLSCAGFSMWQLRREPP